MKKFFYLTGLMLFLFILIGILPLSQSKKQSVKMTSLISSQQNIVASVPSPAYQQENSSDSSAASAKQAFSFDFPEEYYPYRAHLSQKQQEAYDSLYAAALQVQSEVVLDGSLSKEELCTAVHSLHFDQPGLFWLSPDYTYDYNLSGKVTSVTLKYNQTIENLPQAKADFEAALNRITEEAAQYNDPIEQEKYVHDYLVKNCDYTSDYPLDQSAYGALVNQKAVCSGYARAFQLAMQRLGIPVYYCDGYAKKSPFSFEDNTLEKHSWNIIDLDGVYYNIDVTWDDPVNNTNDLIYYDYFNISDQRIGADHERKGISEILPACENDQFDYSSLGIWPENLRANLHTAEEMGYDPYQAIPDLNAYYAAFEQLLINSGTGTHTFTLLLSNQALAEQIHYAVDHKEILEEVVSPYAQQMGLSSYSYSINIKTEVTQDGYVILRQMSSLTEQETQ